MLDCAFKGAVSKTLNFAVDGKRQVRAVLSRADGFDVFHNLAQTILDHPSATGPAAEGILVRELDSLLTDVIDAGESHHVSGYFAAGVVSTELTLLINASESHGLNGGRSVR